MIVTTYKPDGTKERRPIGYGGGLCHEATRPYEKREVPGSVTKTPTAEACQEPAAEVAEQEKLEEFV
jgi:hypothetical protein